MGSTYFITASTAQRRAILLSERMAALLADVLMQTRRRNVLIHDFVIMPEHFHVLLAIPQDLTIKRAVQFIKGGFSFRAKRECGFNGEVWQAGYHDRRVRDFEEFRNFSSYIRANPVKRGLCVHEDEYGWSSANSNFQSDSLPQRLKPR
ncbi:MAG TPA: transposase [Terriglobales bacterium]